MNRRVTGRVRTAVAAVALLLPGFCPAEGLKPAEALDRYVAAQGTEQPACTDSLFAIRIDASLPALKKRGSVTGFKRIVQPGQIAYRGLRFTGDNVVRKQLIARFLARDANPPGRAGDTSITPLNYVFTFDRRVDYNGLAAYVFLMKPRRKRIGLFRGELWLDSATAAPLRVWGDLVKSPSVFIRSIRFVRDYQTVHGCSEPLRLLLTARIRIGGTAEMTIWQDPATNELQDRETDINMEAR